jgi:hypothetical protein
MTSKWFAAALLALTIVSGALAQNAHAPNVPTQSVTAALSTLPEADLLVYVNPQKILNEAAPKVMPAKDIEEMRATFFDIKRSTGLDPATLEYFVIATRVRKPSANLEFVAPEVLAVAGGDFSSDSLLTLIRMAVGDKVRDEKYGTRTIAIVTVDPVVEMAVKNPMLKSFSEMGAVSLTPTSIAIGNVPYLKAAIDAVEGNGRISQAAIQSLLRDPNSLVAISGSPITSFAKSFGLHGTEANAREPRCDTRFGDFYAGVTLSGNNLNLRGAMNADNPDTAKIINGLIAGLMTTAVDSIPDKNAQAVLKGIKLSPRESEIVIEGELPAQTVLDYFRTSKKDEAATSAPAKPRKIVRRKRPVKKS